MPEPTRRPLCRYCFAPTDGGAYRSEACEDGAWEILLTLDGSVVEADKERAPPAGDAHNLMTS
jgi:hypothetical protein